MAANRFLSIPYLLLRSTTAGGALLGGLIQTFVFARVLSHEQFAIFILVGTAGATLWLLDLGIPKILFVRLNAWFLGGQDKDAAIRRYAGAVVVMYFGLCFVCTVICFLIAHFWFATTWQTTLEVTLFFLFTAITLVWFVLRNISVAVDDFLYFESMEVVRRVGHISVMVSPLFGVPFLAFLVIANLIWAGLFVSIVTRLIRRGALAPSASGFWTDLTSFLRQNTREVFNSGTYAANEFFMFNFPYVVVPWAFGIGAPIIILDTAFKVVRGAMVLYSAGCDVAVPRQTRAYSQGDRRSLIIATLMAVALSSLPCVALIAMLAFASEWIFALLLGNAAVMPPEVSRLLMFLLAANLIQTASSFLLVHTGYFRVIARVSTLVSVALAIVTVIAVAAKVDLIGYLQVYTAVYVAGALSYMTITLRGPLRRKS